MRHHFLQCLVTMINCNTLVHVSFLLSVTRDAMGQYIVPTDGKPLTSLGKSICRILQKKQKQITVQHENKIMHNIYIEFYSKMDFYQQITSLLEQSTKKFSQLSICTCLKSIFIYLSNIHCMLEVSSKIKINIRILIIGSKSSPQSSHEQYNRKEKRGVNN